MPSIGRSRTIDFALKIAFFLAIFIMATIKIGDYDIWYHLRAGQFILSTGQINHLDPFSFTAADRPWSVQSWLAGVILYVVYSGGGINALNIFNALIIMAVFLLVYMTMRESEGKKRGFAFAVVLLLIVAYAARFRFNLRPHVFEFLFLSSTLYILALYRHRGKNLLFIIPVIQVLWVNIHGSHILGLILPSVFIAGEAARRLLKTGDAPAVEPARYLRALLMLLAANAAATFVNPVTYQAFLLPFEITGQKLYMANIDEWQRLEWHHLWGYSLRYTWGFSTLFILGVASFILKKRVDVTDILLFIVFLAMAIKGIRLIPEFAIVAAPLIFMNFSRLYAAPKKDGYLKSALFILPLAVVVHTTSFGTSYAFGLGVKPNTFPENAIRFIEENGIRGNVFNSFAFGDYMTWRTPDRKVAIHGRNEVFPEEFYREYLDAHKSPETWKDFTDRYMITYTLLANYLTDYEGKEAITHLAANPGWKPVYWDSVAIVYVKDTPENSGVIERHGYKYIRPSYLDFSYLNIFVERGTLEPVLDELDRLVASSPENEEAYLSRAFVYFMKGPDDYRRAEENLKSAMKLNPRQAITHSALGIIYYETNRVAEAKKAFEKALEIDPVDEAAIAYMKRIEKSP